MSFEFLGVRNTASGKLAVAVAAALLPFAVGAGVPADRTAVRTLPEGVNAARLDAPLRTQRGSADQGARVHYLVRLRSRPASRGTSLAQLDAEHAAFRQERLARVKVVSELRLALNGFVVEADAATAQALANDPRVMHVTRVVDYEMHLEETVPYIGATAVQALGFDGTGIKVAVLDSGIDYTHAAVGGPGTTEAYEAAWGTSPDDPRNTTLDGLFPTARVVAGFDFVGEAWVGGAGTPDLAPDPDPIAAPDANTPGGHGHHVADIIGGNLGVAPGVDLYAVKVCAALSSACSGTALLQGMEFALDPNGDGDMSDRVDIINMSLGANYGQPFDDDLSAAVDNATAIGVLTVASAGNSADTPFITGTPAAAATALSVAQTEVPSALVTQLMTVAEAGDFDAPFQTWSEPLTETISGIAQYGDGAGGALNGCSLDPGNPTDSNPFPEGSVEGKIVMVDRGTCFFSEKIYNIWQAGGILGIIAQNNDDPPFQGGFGGNTPEPEVPGFMISRAAGDLLRGSDTLVTFDPDNLNILPATVRSTSSRGPQGWDTRIKPEIGAPGASVSASSGTGTDANAFGGTSGAAPMVAGSAALLLDAIPGASPLQLKQRLINAGEREVDNALGAGVLAPITRIGGGEVRVDRALALPAIAYNANDAAGGGLSFGLVRVGREEGIRVREVAVENLSADAVTYSIQPTFRYADDADAGIAALDLPASITVAPGAVEKFRVTLRITGANLPANAMDSGVNGTDPGPLTTQELDGYLEFVADDHTMTLPWHALAIKAAHVVPDALEFVPDGGIAAVGLTNFGVGTAQPDVFSLLATSEDLPEGDRGDQSPTPDLRAVGVATFGTDSCASGFVWVFGVAGWEPERQLLPVVYQAVLDTDRDGTDDYAVLNLPGDLVGLPQGQSLTYAENLATGELVAFFYTVHSTGSLNVQLTICGEQVGLTAEDLGNTPVDVRFEAIDFYFGGPGDVIDGLTITPGGEQYVGAAPDLAAGAVGTLEITDFGRLPENTPELGVMVFTDGLRALPGAASLRTQTLLLRAAGN